MQNRKTETAKGKSICSQTLPPATAPSSTGAPIADQSTGSHRPRRKIIGGKKRNSNKFTFKFATHNHHCDFTLSPTISFLTRYCDLIVVSPPPTTTSFKYQHNYHCHRSKNPLFDLKLSLKWFMVLQSCWQMLKKRRRGLFGEKMEVRSSSR